MVHGQDFRRTRETESYSFEKWLQEGRALHDQAAGAALIRSMAGFARLFSRKKKEDAGKLNGIGHSV